MSFAGFPPKKGNFLITEIWDRHLSGWREKVEIDLTDKNIKHEKIVEHLKKFTEAPTLSSEDVDFDMTNTDSLSLKRMVSKKKGSWFQIPAHMEPNKK